jgi:hypothetical protein
MAAGRLVKADMALMARRVWTSPISILFATSSMP